MSLADAAFLVGPVGAPVLAPLALVALLVVREPLWVLWAGVGLMAVVVLAWVGYWVAWGQAFERVDALDPVPAGLDGVLDALLAVCAVGCVALTATATYALLHRRRSVGSDRARGKAGS